MSTLPLTTAPNRTARRVLAGGPAVAAAPTVTSSTPADVGRLRTVKAGRTEQLAAGVLTTGVRDAPNSWTQTIPALGLMATPIPISRYDALSVVLRCPAEPIQAAITISGVACPRAMFSPTDVQPV